MLALCSWVVELFGSFVSLDGKEGSEVRVGVEREREIKIKINNISSTT